MQTQQKSGLTIDTDLSHSGGTSQDIGSLAYKGTVIVFGYLCNTKLTDPIVVVDDYVPITGQRVPVVVPLESGKRNTYELALKVHNASRGGVLRYQLLDHDGSLFDLRGDLSDDFLRDLGSGVFDLYRQSLRDLSGLDGGYHLLGFWCFLQSDFNWSKLLGSFLFKRRESKIKF